MRALWSGGRIKSNYCIFGLVAAFLALVVLNEYFSFGLDSYKRIGGIVIGSASVAITVPSLIFFKKIKTAFAIFLFQGACTIHIFAEQYMESGLLDSASRTSIAVNKSQAIYFSVMTWLNQPSELYFPSQDALLFVSAQRLLGYLYMAIMLSLVVSYRYTLPKGENT